MERWATIVAVIGGLVAIITAVIGTVAYVADYFATRDDLRIVDFYQYRSTQALSAQNTQIFTLPKYKELQKKAAESQIRYERDTKNPDLLAAYKEAVRVQNEEYEKLTAAQTQSKNELKELQGCGHGGVQQFQPSR